MSGILDDNTIGLACPEPACGHKTHKAIGWLKEHSEYVCDRCGATVRLDIDGLMQQIRTVEDAARDLGVWEAPGIDVI